MAGKRGGQVLHESRWSYGVEAGVTAVAEVVQRQAVGGGEWRYPIAPQSAVFRGVSGPPIVGGSRKLAGRGSALPGSEYEFLLCFPGEAGASYLTGASLALRPGIQLSNGKYVPLAPDGLLTWSLSDPGTFAGFVGTLDGASRARAVWRIPGVPGLRGVRVYFAALTLGPAGVATVSDPIGVSIQ
jgi:hypothetical protein